MPDLLRHLRDLCRLALGAPFVGGWLATLALIAGWRLAGWVAS